MTSSLTKKIAKSLKDSEYRRAFLLERAKVDIAYQVRAMREKRDWSQAELGALAGGIPQTVISRIEDPNYGRMTLSTLNALACAFDTPLIVRFGSYSEVVVWMTSEAPEKLLPPSYSDDARLEELISATSKRAVRRVVQKGGYVTASGGKESGRSAELTGNTPTLIIPGSEATASAKEEISVTP